MHRFMPGAHTEPHIIGTLTVRLYTGGMNGGVLFDSVTCRNVPVDLVYTTVYALEDVDGVEKSVARPKIQSIRATRPAWFDSESGAVLSFTVGYCLMKIMDDHDVQALEDELLKKLEGK